MGLTMREALSDRGISAIQESAEIGKDMLKSDFYSASVTRLLKSGFWADIESKDGRKFKISVKKNGSETIITRR